jgi:MYXO-CTERM domain-containing protein
MSRHSTRARALPLLLAVAACTAPRPDEGEAIEPLAAPDFPAIGFEERPDYIPNNVLVLTFDDGPDWNQTARVLDTLRDEDVKATFFINTRNWSNVDDEAPMQALVRRMVDEGHELGNHTVSHGHLGAMSAEQVEAEVAGVERTVQTVFGAAAPRVTLLRAPFGEPYQVVTPALDVVAPVVARHAVHVGWQIDSADSTTSCRTADCVYNTTVGLIRTPGQGRYGQVLMHSVQQSTADMLPRLIEYARDNGFVFWTTEQMVCAKYGSSSANLVAGRTGGCADDPEPPVDGGTGGRPDGGTGGRPDARPGRPDARPSDPGRPDARPPGPGEPDASDDPPVDDPDGELTGGCGCRAGSGAGAVAPLALGALALVLRRRRR